MYTVVVADDERELREALVKRIPWNEIGFSIIGEAENGADALELVSQLKPDLLLTDIRMPFVSGLELARQVREVRPATQIAFLSGYDDFAYAQQAIQYNVISYLLKPISVAEMTKSMKEIKEKIDRIFEDFAKIQKGEENNYADFYLPLLLNRSYFESEEAREKRLLEEQELRGMFRPGREEWKYVVLSMVLSNEEGQNCTEQKYIGGVNRILKKYTDGISFYIDGRIVTVVYASPNAMQKYLHILAEDLVESMERILGISCRIGIGNVTGQLTGLYDSCHASAKALSSITEPEQRIIYITDVNLTEETPDVCRAAMEKVKKGYANPDISLVSVSEEIGISPNYLSMLIKRRTGKAFNDYLTTRRMEAAERLLKETEMKIREVSEKCGYSDQHYFSYCFKKYAGISPNMLKRQMKEQQREWM